MNVSSCTLYVSSFWSPTPSVHIAAPLPCIDNPPISSFVEDVAQIPKQTALRLLPTTISILFISTGKP